MKYTQIKNGQAIVTINGSFNLRLAEELRREMEEVVNSGEKELIVDMSKTVYMDSAGLGVLVDIKEMLEEVEGRIEVIGLTGHCLELFQTTMLYDEFCS